VCCCRGRIAIACSNHLRNLERFGLVERVEPDPGGAVDGRTRRWRSVATGFDFGEPARTGSPELVAATAAGWRGVAAFSTYALLVSADELGEVLDAIDAIVRPLRGVARTDASTDARPVRMALEAFPRTDLA